MMIFIILEFWKIIINIFQLKTFFLKTFLQIELNLIKIFLKTKYFYGLSLPENK